MSPDAAGYRFACDWLEKKKQISCFGFIYIYTYSQLRKEFIKKKQKTSMGKGVL